MGILLLIPILFPILAGAVVFFLRDRKVRRIYISAVVVIDALMVYALAAFVPDTTLTVWTISGSLEVGFQLDGLARFFSCLIVSVWALVAFFAFEYITHEGKEERFLAFYTMTMGVLVGLSFSSTMPTLYMMYELMTIITVPLVIHSRTREAIVAGLKYLGYSVFGAGCGLFGMFFLNKYCTTLSFVDGGSLNLSLVAGNENLILFVYLVMMIGFGCKAGMLPLHAWLPTAHPVAPAPASAVLSGVITKGGVLAIIRVTYFMVGPDFLRGTWVQYTLMALAIGTVFMGSMLAFKEKLLKKRMAYSTVSNVSYVLFGLFMMTSDGFTGALLQVLFHSIAKNILFCCAGAIIYKTHKTYVYELKGIGKQMPIVMWCFTLASLSLIGIPPLAGFVSKWFLATGGIAACFDGMGFLPFLGAAVLMASALLTAGYLMSIVRDAFFPGKDFNYATLKKEEPNALMTVPLIIMSVAVVVLGMFPTGLTTAINCISSTLL